MSEHAFHDRRDAGKQLAAKVAVLAKTLGLSDQPLVLALPRGGAPVAFEVALALGAPLDVLPVRKLGLPGAEEYAIGAIAAVDGDPVQVVDEAVLAAHPELRPPLEGIVQREWAELLRRRRVYRGNRPALDLAHRDVILVDDGLATGSTMRAAILAARQAQARRVVVAVPVADCDAYAEVCDCADACTCVVGTEAPGAVSDSYADFAAVSDMAVTSLLTRAEHMEEEPMLPLEPAAIADRTRSEPATPRQREPDATTGALR